MEIWRFEKHIALSEKKPPLGMYCSVPGTEINAIHFFSMALSNHTAITLLIKYMIANHFETCTYLLITMQGRRMLPKAGWASSNAAF